jgi:hypothetical protein
MLFVVATFLKASTFVIYSLECILASIALISTIQLTPLDASLFLPRVFDAFSLPLPLLMSRVLFADDVYSSFSSDALAMYTQLSDC